mgnify:CR=1 FL=1
MYRLFFRKNKPLASLSCTAHTQDMESKKAHASGVENADITGAATTSSPLAALANHNATRTPSDSQVKLENDFIWLVEAEKNLRWAS